jgi:hypothetical protein
MPAWILRQSGYPVPKGETVKRVKLILFGAVALVMFAGSATASAVYEVDEDHDGRVDRLLILEQSDSLA